MAHAIVALADFRFINCLKPKQNNSPNNSKCCGWCCFFLIFFLFFCRDTPIFSKMLNIFTRKRAQLSMPSCCCCRFCCCYCKKKYVAAFNCVALATAGSSGSTLLRLSLLDFSRLSFFLLLLRGVSRSVTICGLALGNAPWVKSLPESPKQ